jgi:peptidoglycan/xylan/chitin deacetylase (PgdA/CDA1 family)
MALLKRGKEALCFGVRWSGLPFVARHTYGRRRVAILAYHEPTADLLEEHLGYLARRYRFVTLEAVVEALSSGDWQSLPARGVVVTIDDGKRCSYEFTELFTRYGVVPTLYVCSQLVGTNRRFWFDVASDPEALKRIPHEQRVRELQADGFTLTGEGSVRVALSLAETAEMGEAVDIQSHSRLHPVLTTCLEDLCREEIVGSRTDVEELTGKPCTHFCFPNGDYTERELEIVREAGYRSARTVRTGWTGPTSDPYELRILGVDDLASVNQLAADLAGFGFFEGFIRRGRPGNPSGLYRPITLDDRSAR